MKWLLILLIWFVISLPIGVRVGKLLKRRA